LRVTNEDVAFREVDQAIAEERQTEFLKKYGAVVIGGASAIVLGVAGWQFWNAQSARTAETAAAELQSASETLAATPEDGRLALEAFSAEAPSGYALMADLRRAGSLAGEGDREGALLLLRKVYGDRAAPKRLRELARLRAATLALSDGRDAALGDLGDLVQSKDPMGPYAREIAAVAALTAKDYEGALAMFREAADDASAPETLRQRARELAALAASGKAGVNLTGEARLEDIVKALGDPQSDAAPPDNAE
jgi:hypothetical protein